MDPNKPDPPKPRSADPSDNVPEPELDDLYTYLSESPPYVTPFTGESSHSTSTTNTAPSAQNPPVAAEDMNVANDDDDLEIPKYNPATDAYLMQMRAQTMKDYPIGIFTNTRRYPQIFQRMTNDTKRILREANERDYDHRPLDQKVSGYVPETVDEVTRWKPDLGRQIGLDLLALKAEGTPTGSEGRGVLMTSSRGNMRSVIRRAQLARLRSREVARRMKEFKGRGRSRQLVERSRVMLHPDYRNSRNRELERIDQRLRDSKRPWRGFKHRRVFQRSQYKVHAQNTDWMKDHMKKRRRMIRKGLKQTTDRKSKFKELRHIKPIPSVWEFGYESGHVRNLPDTLEPLDEGEELREWTTIFNKPYFPKRFVGYPSRGRPAPPSPTTPPMMTPPHSPLSDMPTTPGKWISPKASEGSSDEASHTSDSDDSEDDNDDDIADTDADTDAEF